MFEEDNKVYCPVCGDFAFIETNDGYMIGNIIINECQAGTCGCGQIFQIKKDVLIWIMKIE